MPIPWQSLMGQGASIDVLRWHIKQTIEDTELTHRLHGPADNLKSNLH